VAALREQAAEMTVLREQLRQMTAERDAARKFADNLQRVIEERDAVSEQLARCKEVADILAAENTSLRDTVESLRDKQIHPDLPGLLAAIQRLAEQARELI
jgi:uncharacterized coiled-coil DUF342 family protein